MSFPLQTHNFSSNQPSKSVFVTGKNQHKLNCNFFDLFQHQGILTCSQGPKLQQITPIKSHKPRDMTGTKLTKKSLKSHSQYHKFFQNTIKKDQGNLNKFQTKKDKKIQNLAKNLSRQASKVFSKTTSSEIGYNIIRKPAAGYSQALKSGHHSYKCSSENIINSSFHKGQLSQSCKLERQRLSHIPMVQSISKNSLEGLAEVRLSREVRPLVNPEVFNFQRIKFVDSISQSLDMLGISPVKQIAIPQVSERSGANSRNPTQRQELTVSKKLLFKAPPQIRKNISDDYSDFLRTTGNKKIEDSIKQSIPLETVQEQRKSNVFAYDQIKVQFEVKERDFLQTSFEKQGQQMIQKQDGNCLDQIDKRYEEFNQGGKEKSVGSCKDSEIYYESMRKSQVNNSKLNSSSRKLFSAQGKYIIKAQQQNHQQPDGEPQDSREVLNEVLQSSIQSSQQKSESQECGAIQKREIPKFKAPKLQHIPFGRHSVQIPRSKKFSGMKVRRTISMRDQQESEEQQTSEVIYGFRKTHKQAIMEEINEDMQDSCVTRTQHNFNNNNINLSDFRQLLL